MAMRVAILDLGSYTFHYAVFQRTPGGVARMDSAKEIVRLARGLPGEVLGPAALTRADQALARLVPRARREGCPVVALATSALRDAPDGADFLSRARRRHGLSIEVLSGPSEAQLVYAAARHQLRRTGRMTVVDLGGGSLDLASGSARLASTATSLPLGVLRTGALRTATPESAVQNQAALAAARIRAAGTGEVVFMGGTARALARFIHRLERLGGPVTVDREQLASVAGRLSLLSAAEAISLGADPDRADTLATGARLLLAMLDVLEAPSARVVRASLREGVALRELGGEPAPLAAHG